MVWTSIDFARGDHSPPPEYGGISAPIVVYVGEIAEWFDFATLRSLAGLLPDHVFVLVGPDEIARERLSDIANVRILGRRPFSEVPRYLANADVGLIPFDVRDHGPLVHAVHPLKLYEYLACGLPVVATRWKELERLGSPAVLCDEASEMASTIRAIVAEPPDPQPGIEFARGATWDIRVRTLVSALGGGPGRDQPSMRSCRPTTMRTS